MRNPLKCFWHHECFAGETHVVEATTKDRFGNPTELSDSQIISVVVSLVEGPRVEENVSITVTPAKRLVAVRFRHLVRVSPRNV